MLNPINHHAIRFNNEIVPYLSTLCEPLFDNFGITVFGYSHFFSNGTYLDICTDLQWQQHYICHFASHSFIKNYIQKTYEENTRYVLWDNRVDVVREEMFSKFIIDSCDHNICHGFSIYEKHENSLETWHFATQKENYQIINFYLNRLEILHHFISYFKDRTRKILSASESKHLIVLDDGSPFYNISEEASDEVKTQEFLDQTTIKNFSINTGHSTTSLSKREVDCIRHLSTRKTIKEIGRTLNLSPRTVESYLNNVKKKLNCNNKSDLVNLFIKNGLYY